MRRGEIWLVQGIGRDRHVLIVSNNALLDSTLGSVLAVSVDTGGALAGSSMVTVALSHPVEATVRAHEVATIRRERFARQVGVVDAHSMDMVDAALRAALDL